MPLDAAADRSFVNTLFGSMARYAIWFLCVLTFALRCSVAVLPACNRTLPLLLLLMTESSTVVHSRLRYVAGNVQ